MYGTMANTSVCRLCIVVAYFASSLGGDLFKNSVIVIPLFRTVVRALVPCWYMTVGKQVPGFTSASEFCDYWLLLLIIIMLIFFLEA